MQYPIKPNRRFDERATERYSPNFLPKAALDSA